MMKHFRLLPALLFSLVLSVAAFAARPDNDLALAASPWWFHASLVIAVLAILYGLWNEVVIPISSDALFNPHCHICAGRGSVGGEECLACVRWRGRL